MERNNNMEDTRQNQQHSFFFFGNEQSIINALHLYMIRRPHELLNNNKEPQGRTISTYQKNVITCWEEKCRDETRLLKQSQKLKYDIHSKTSKDGCADMSLTHENRPFPWLQFLWSIFVPTLCLKLTQQQLFHSVEMSTMILDIRWDLACWIILMILLLYSFFNNPLHFVNNEKNVFKRQFYDRFSIAKEAFLSVLYKSGGLNFRDALFQRIATKQRLEITNSTEVEEANIARKRPPKRSSYLVNNTINNNNSFLKTIFILLTMINMIQFPSGTLALRCYTDITASKSHSQECGLNTGCVKIYIDSEDMLYKKQTDMGFGYGYKPGKFVLIKTL